MRKANKINFERRGFLIASVVFFVLAAPVAYGGTMGNGGAQRQAAASQTQADKDAIIAKRCQTQTGLMNTPMCKDSMAKHPELFGAKPKATPTH